MRSRKGMILLVVMSVLALFAVMGMTFILLTGRNRDSAESSQKAAQESKTAGNSAQELLEEGIMQVLTGPPQETNNNQSKHSALYHNDLLGDMYGYAAGNKLEGVTFTKDAATNLLCFNCTDATISGRVITITSGKLKGNSTLILKQENGAAYCLPFASDPVLDGVACECLVNRKAFQGSADYDAFEPDSANNKFMSLRYPGGIANCAIPEGRVVVPSYYRKDIDGGLRPGWNNGQEKKNKYSELASDDGTVANSPWDVDNDGDGDKDSVWMNLGLPPRAMPDGTMVVPMYAILVEDMDGRINVNAHGQYDDLAAAAPTGASAAGNGSFNGPAGDSFTPNNTSYGVGYGPGEINLSTISPTPEKIIQDRNSPGGANYPEDLGFSKYKFLDLITGADYKSTNAANILNYSFNVNHRYYFYRSPPDFFGNFSCVIDKYGMPAWIQNRAPNFSHSPYELDLGWSQPRGSRISSRFCLYSPEELERVLRIYDDDSTRLEHRLADNLGANNHAESFSRVRHLVTTESWDLPLCPNDLIGSANFNNLPLEVKAGFKMDINRPLRQYPDVKDNADAGVNKNYVEAADLDRQNLAKDFYYLLRAVAPNIPVKQAAQWAVNAVDFRDSDSVCTRLEIDGVTVYGVERPEALITETFAYHARMTEDSELGGWVDDKKHAKDVLEMYDPAKCKSVEDFRKNYPEMAKNFKDEKEIKSLIDKITKDKKNGPTGEISLDQLVRPESGLFIEIYNPWMCAGKSEPFCPLMYDNPKKDASVAATGLNLGKMTNNGSDHVWRMIVIDPNKVGKKDDNYANDYIYSEANVPESAIYFSKISSPEKRTDYAFEIPDKEVILLPGKVAVVGPGNTSANNKFTEVYLENIVGQNNAAGSRKSITLSENSICFDGDTQAVTGLPVEHAKSNSNQRLSVTEDDETNKLYRTKVCGDLKDNDRSNTPFDMQRGGNKWESLTTDDSGKAVGLGDNFVKSGYRVVYLQRLANPYLKYDQTTNPYINIDSMPIDLYCYSGRQSVAQMIADHKSGSKYGAEKKFDTNKNNITPASRRRGVLNSANLWAAETITKVNNGAGASQQNFGSRVVGAGKGKADGLIPTYEQTPAFYFPNRPFMSVMEMLMIPQTAAYDLTCSANAISKPENLTNLPRYLNPNNGGIDFINGNAAKIFNYLRIQSPFSDTTMTIGTYDYNSTGKNNGNNPGGVSMENYRWSYREAGKLNINSILHPSVWAAMLNQPTVKNYQITQNVDGTEDYMKLPGMSDGLFNNHWMGIFKAENPTRTVFSSNKGLNYLTDNTNILMLKNTNALAYNSPSQCVYFQLPLMQRASNLTTTRSNVYAVWITVGFFEYTGEGNDDVDAVSQFCVGKEYGLDNGSRQRYRGFYLIDRTRPVGYEPGKRYNADKTILLRRYLP